MLSQAIPYLAALLFAAWFTPLYISHHFVVMARRETTPEKKLNLLGWALSWNENQLLWLQLAETLLAVAERNRDYHASLLQTRSAREVVNNLIRKGFTDPAELFEARRILERITDYEKQVELLSNEAAEAARRRFKIVGR